jgi:hypothetical protein
MILYQSPSIEQEGCNMKFVKVPIPMPVAPAAKVADESLYLPISIVPVVYSEWFILLLK